MLVGTLKTQSIENPVRLLLIMADNGMVCFVVCIDNVSGEAMYVCMYVCMYVRMLNQTAGVANCSRLLNFAPPACPSRVPLRCAGGPAD